MGEGESLNEASERDGEEESDFERRGEEDRDGEREISEFSERSRSVEQWQRSIRAVRCGTMSRHDDDDEDDDGRTNVIRNGGSASVTNGMVSLLRAGTSGPAQPGALRATS